MILKYISEISFDKEPDFGHYAHDSQYEDEKDFTFQSVSSDDGEISAKEDV